MKITVDAQNEAALCSMIGILECAKDQIEMSDLSDMEDGQKVYQMIELACSHIQDCVPVPAQNEALTPFNVADTLEKMRYTLDNAKGALWAFYNDLFDSSSPSEGYTDRYDQYMSALWTALTALDTFAGQYDILLYGGVGNGTTEQDRKLYATLNAIGGKWYRRQKGEDSK